MSLYQILETIFIGPLKLVFEYIFYFAYKIVDHPGLAIIVLSLAMNILVLPLYRRADAMQEASRDVEAKLSRGVAHIKKVFTGDERMMILQTYYRQNNYKPTDALKGSVSLLLEVPFFMAAYQFLSSATALENTAFGPIADLGAPDQLIVIGGIAINLLPVVMTLINVISSAIYLKGFPLKTKIQLYGMALFFLVFLYNSPSGLVFYWTLNNVFSLCKTVFYKLKNPKRAGMALLFIAGAAILSFGLFFYEPVSAKRKLFLLIVGTATMLLPVALALLSKLPAPKNKPVANRKQFVVCGLLLTVLVGCLIPSAVISASPQEFVDPANFYNPLWYILHTVCMAAGTFLVWIQVFYWLANDTGKVIFEKLLFILCGAMLVNYMFFGTKLGILSASLQYESGMYFSTTEQVINLGVWALLAIVLLFVSFKWPKPILSVVLVASIAIGGMSAVNIFSAGAAVKRFANGDTAATASGKTYFTLSQTEENVVVIMLDRGLGQMVPYLFQERPELAEQFDGFTYYDNTLSFGRFTNFGTPALLGGYDYTPVEMNRRSDEALVDKHNEALLTLPVLFDENGFDVTICDPVYANYQWVPDLSIYQDYPDINVYITEGAMNPNEDTEALVRSTSRNFFCFSLMKTLPVSVQSVVYGYGNYNQLDTQTVQTVSGMSTAYGYYNTFLNSYYVLNELPNMTGISSDSNGAFMFMTNNITHNPCLLQEPDYVPALVVDNTAFDAANTDRFVYNDRTLNINNMDAMRHYQANMAAMIQLGNWFDYLRENDVYDNTRIILVADHGSSMNLEDELITEDQDIGGYFPLLMVKDFNAEGFTTCSDFMTNADVPSLATEGVIENPVNPFTGNPINMDEKTAHEQIVIVSTDWDIVVNNGNTYLPARWASISDNIWDLDSWKFTDEETVLTQHSLS